MHYVIIGASAAGLSAAETLRQIDSEARITLISRERETAYSRCLATYYIAGKIKREGLFIRTREQMAALNADLLAPAEVTAVDAANRLVTLADSRAVPYDRLLAASGAAPVMPAVPGLAGPGVFALRTAADADAIAAAIAAGDPAGAAPSTAAPSAPRRAVVLGDGLVAVTAAQALLARGLAVTLVGTAPHILASFLDGRAAAILQRHLEAADLSLCLGETFARLTRDESGRLTGADLSGGRHVPAELAVVAIGVKPDFGFLAGTGAASDRGLLVNEFMETSVPGIYAAGDVAQCRDFLRGAAVPNPLWPNAVEQGQYAAYAMAGRGKPYRGSSNMNSLNIAGVPVIAAGLAAEESPGGETHVLTDTGTVYEKLVFQGDTLVGFILLGRTDKAGVLTNLVFEQNTTPAQKTRLLEGRFSYTALSGVSV